jgi:hypothetical protein
VIPSDSTARRQYRIDGTAAGFIQILQEMLITLNDSNKSFERSIVENLGLLVPRLEHLCIKSSATWKTQAYMGG